jgi:hypothetical protein
MENIEIWKDIPNYNGYYKVSSFGRVKSLKYNRETILIPFLDTYGYYSVKLSQKNKAKCHKIHKLVAICFLGHIQNKFKEVVDHIDNNPKNNNVNNLQLISQRENASKDRKGYTSKFIGVYWAKTQNKWIVQMFINGKRTHLGQSKCELKAAMIYKETLKKVENNTWKN